MKEGTLPCNEIVRPLSKKADTYDEGSLPNHSFQNQVFLYQTEKNKPSNF